MSKNVFEVGRRPLSIKTINELVSNRSTLKLHESAQRKITNSRKFLDEFIKDSDTPIYGINTGFGSLHDTTIGSQDLEQLQENLVMSHACGAGDEVPAGIVKMMLLLKVQNLALGHSGVQLQTVQRLIDFYNHGILPVIYQQGSLGASGDLAPLAHLSLPLLGKGDVYYNGKRIKAASVLKKLGWKPLSFRSKEALALLNGTQFMSAYAVDTLIESYKLFNWSNVIASVSIDAYEVKQEPFDELLHKVRPHEGQILVAKAIRSQLKNSKLFMKKKKHVQDPYSFRCIPQVHGASYDALMHVTKVIETEINSVTDNPTLFPDEEKIYSGGNFHGQPLALVMDYFAMAMAELGSISERRTYLLISGQRGLPAYLVSNPGLNSGFMIPQYTAASIVSQNKQLCTPASVDSITSSNGQEDHVSMGANAAVKLHKIVSNLKSVLSIELFTAAQAIEFRGKDQSSSLNKALLSAYRKKVPFLKKDGIMEPHINKSRTFLDEFVQ